MKLLTTTLIWLIVIIISLVTINYDVHHNGTTGLSMVILLFLTLSTWLYFELIRFYADEFAKEQAIKEKDNHSMKIDRRV